MFESFIKRSAYDTQQVINQLISKKSVFKMEKGLVGVPRVHQSDQLSLPVSFLTIAPLFLAHQGLGVKISADEIPSVKA